MRVDNKTPLWILILSTAARGLILESDNHSQTRWRLELLHAVSRTTRWWCRWVSFGSSSGPKVNVSDNIWPNQRKV